MTMKVRSISVVSLPNFFQEAPWETTPGTAIRLYGQLMLEDGLGLRRYVPASGATVKVDFLRARSLTPQNPVQQTIQKNAVVAPEDRSMFYIDLTTADTQSIISGTVRFIVTEAGQSNTFLMNYFITRKPITPGN